MDVLLAVLSRERNERRRYERDPRFCSTVISNGNGGLETRPLYHPEQQDLD